MCDPKVYDEFDKSTGFGSNTIMSYVAEDGSVNIFVCLLGLVIYNVRLLPQRIPRCRYNAICQELNIEGDKKTFCHETINEVVNTGIENIIDLTKKVENCALQGISADDEAHILRWYDEFYLYVANQSFPAYEENTIYDLLSKRIEYMITHVFLTANKLKRFIKEHKILSESEIKLNPQGTKEDDILCYYALFLCGKDGDEIQTMSDLYQRINRNSTFEEMRAEMLETEGYVDFIRGGATFVMSKGVGKSKKRQSYVFKISIEDA